MQEKMKKLLDNMKEVVTVLENTKTDNKEMLEDLYQRLLDLQLDIKYDGLNPIDNYLSYN